MNSGILLYVRWARSETADVVYDMNKSLRRIKALEFPPFCMCYAPTFTSIHTPVCARALPGPPYRCNCVLPWTLSPVKYETTAIQALIVLVKAKITRVMTDASIVRFICDSHTHTRLAQIVVVMKYRDRSWCGSLLFVSLLRRGLCYHGNFTKSESGALMFVV